MRLITFAAAYLLVTNLPARATELLKLGAPFDEKYRALFAECDAHDTFGGAPVAPIHRCKKDPSRFDHLARVPAAGGAPGAVIIESKIAHDDDGAAKWCPPNKPKGTSQCQTALLLPATTAHLCKWGSDKKACVPTDPDAVPYAAIPGSSFSHLGIMVGDYGVVVVGDKTIPFIVADSGPKNKIGEGSTALLTRLSGAGPKTIDSGALFVMFPGTKKPVSTLSPDTLPQFVETHAAALYKVFRKSNP